jgi:hypothetical protein
MLRPGRNQVELASFHLGLEVFWRDQGRIFLASEFILALQRAQSAFELIDNIRLMVESFLLEEITDAGCADD